MQLEKLHSNIFLPHHLFFHDIMLEIAELKQKKLPELQEIAKGLGIKGITGQKKMDLAYSIIDHIASQPETKKEKQEDTKPKETSKKTPKEQASKNL